MEQTHGPAVRTAALLLDLGGGERNLERHPADPRRRAFRDLARRAGDTALRRLFNLFLLDVLAHSNEAGRGSQ